MKPIQIQSTKHRFHDFVDAWLNRMFEQQPQHVLYFHDSLFKLCPLAFTVVNAVHSRVIMLSAARVASSSAFVCCL